VDHEGHVGYEAIGIANQDLLRGWLDKVKPVDIGMILLGTNDVVCISRDDIYKIASNRVPSGVVGRWTRVKRHSQN
jgi:hypothetical protein